MNQVLQAREKYLEHKRNIINVEPNTPSDEKEIDKLLEGMDLNWDELQELFEFVIDSSFLALTNQGMSAIGDIFFAQYIDGLITGIRLERERNNNE